MIWPSGSCSGSAVSPRLAGSAPVAQLDRASVYGTEGREFESLRARLTVTELWRRGQVGWPQRFPIAQFPNPPLLVALVGRGLAAGSGGATREAGRVVFTLGLVVWAWQEAAGGVNWLRRLVGMGALVWIAVRLIDDL